MAPATAPPAMAGYIVGSVVGATTPPSPDMVKEFMAMAKALPADFGFQKIVAGPALKQYEMGKGKPNMSFVIKFASVAKASEFYEAPAYVAWKEKFGVGVSIMRDLRIIEAPADLFTPGKAYWFALIHRVVDTDMTMKYLDKFMEINGRGFGVTLEDGSVSSASMQLKYVGPSEPKEEALKVVPSKDEAKPFFMGTTSDQALVAFGEFDSHAIGAQFRESSDYKSALLAAFDATYEGDDEAYEAAMVKFSDTVFRRDVRIIGV